MSPHTCICCGWPTNLQVSLTPGGPSQFICGQYPRCESQESPKQPFEVSTSTEIWIGESRTPPEVRAEAVRNMTPEQRAAFVGDIDHDAPLCDVRNDGHGEELAARTREWLEVLPVPPAFVADVHALLRMVEELTADIGRYSHGKLATRCDAAEREREELRAELAEEKRHHGATNFARMQLLKELHFANARVKELSDAINLESK